MAKGVGYVYCFPAKSEKEILAKLKKRARGLGGSVDYIGVQSLATLVNAKGFDFQLHDGFMGNPLVVVNGLDMKKERELRKAIPNLLYLGPNKALHFLPDRLKKRGKTLLVRGAHLEDHAELVALQKAFKKKDRATPKKIMQRIINGQSLVAETVSYNPNGSVRGSRIEGEISRMPMLFHKRKGLLSASSPSASDYSESSPAELWINLAKRPGAPKETTLLLISEAFFRASENNVQRIFGVLVPDKTGKKRSEPWMQKLGFVYTDVKNGKGIIALPLGESHLPKDFSSAKEIWKYPAKRIREIIDGFHSQGLRGQALYKKAFDELATKVHKNKSDAIAQLYSVRDRMDGVAALYLHVETGKGLELAEKAVMKARRAEKHKSDEHFALQALKDIHSTREDKLELSVCRPVINRARKHLK